VNLIRFTFFTPFLCVPANCEPEVGVVIESEKNCVLSGGDDYELLFTAPRERRREIDALSGELGVALTRIGAIQSGQPRLAIVDAAGKPMPFRGGFDHFAQR